jgi:hypothetical protein
MRKDLLGYLLDALDDRERQRVVDALRRDPKLRSELEELRQSLHLLDASGDDVRPPEGLADQTCDLVEACDAVPEVFLARSVGRSDERFARLSSDPRDFEGRTRNWSAADTIAAVGIFLALSMLFFPAIAGSRFRSRITACQNNLQCIGHALADYSEAKGGYFPAIPISGNRSAAGIYGPKLFHDQFLLEPAILICPGSGLADQVDGFRPPTLFELDRASAIELLGMHRTMGGSYGYSLGYRENGRYCTPRYRGRASYALMSDAPSLYLVASQSDNHGGKGQNVLFEDLRVEFLSTSLGNEGFDNLFRSRRGYFEAGLDDDDSVIAPSFLRPIMVY